jgi:hypothetical protein
MAGTYGKYYEEIFGTHFYETLLSLNCDGGRFVIAWILYKFVYKREQNRYLLSTSVCYLTNAQEIRHFLGFHTEIIVK